MGLIATTLNRVLIAIVLLLGSLAFGQSIPSAFVYQGRLFTSDGITPILDTVQFKLQILDPTASCLLYEELQSNYSLAASGGMFSLSIGSEVGSVKRGTNDPGLSMIKIFSNNGMIRPATSDGFCPTGYTPAAGDKRKLKVSVINQQSGTVTILSPLSDIVSTPYSAVAETLQGKGPESFVQINSDKNLTQTNLESIFGEAGFSKLQDILNGNFTGNSSTATTSGNVSGVVAIVNGGTGANSVAQARSNLGLGTIAIMSPTGTAGANTYLRGDGTWASVTFNSPVSSVSGRTGDIILSTSDVQGLDSALNSKVSASKLSLNCNANETISYISVSDSYQCQGISIGNTNISSMAANKLTGTLSVGILPSFTGDVTSVAGSGVLTVSDSAISSNKIADGAVSTSKLGSDIGVWSTDGTNVNRATGNVGIGVGSPTQKLEVAGNVKATQLCIGADCRSAWPSGGGGGSVNSVAAAATAGNPITIGGTAADPTLDIPKATGSVSGYLSAADFTTFSNKLSSITSGNVTTALGYTPLSPSNNLSDVASASSARTNLGLGTSALKNAPATGNAASTEVVLGNDTRLTDSRIPSGSAGGDLTGSYPDPTIASGAITSTKIGDGAITTAKLFTNPGINRLVATDGSTGAGLTSLSCSAGELLYWTVASGWQCTTNQIVVNGSNIGLGTASPRATVDVNGTLIGKASVLNSTSTIDFSSGNLQHTNSSCGAFTLTNLKDGGSYTLIVKGTSSATCSFTAYSDSGTAPNLLSNHMPPGHGPTTAGTHTMYSVLVSGTDVYFSWIPGY